MERSEPEELSNPDDESEPVILRNPGTMSEPGGVAIEQQLRQPHQAAG